MSQPMRQPAISTFLSGWPLFGVVQKKRLLPSRVRWSSSLKTAPSQESNAFGTPICCRECSAKGGRAECFGSLFQAGQTLQATPRRTRHSTTQTWKRSKNRRDGIADRHQSPLQRRGTDTHRDTHTEQHRRQIHVWVLTGREEGGPAGSRT